MQLSEFDYYLPPELIAQTPIEPRDHSRLLILEKSSGDISDRYFYSIDDELGKNDVLVVNKTRVINARLKGCIKTGLKGDSPSPMRRGMGGGGEVEIFLHSQIDNKTWDCLIYPGRKLKVGTQVKFPSPLRRGKGGGSSLVATIKSISESGRIVEFNLSGDTLDTAIEQIGQTPLPPYIKAKNQSPERYQTVYSQDKGSVAAPTAGLHFTSELLEKLQKKGVHIEHVLLHVGLGTFKGVEVEDITQHHMHTEYCAISDETANRLNEYKKQGKRIIAVGTTSVRTLESFTDGKGILHSGEKHTNIFIYPGYTWKFVDSIVTNFHLPKSTLLMLISSFAGKEYVDTAYEHAIKEKYRFFSFGDAMWIR